jgi:hypothetical protein
MTCTHGSNGAWCARCYMDKYLHSCCNTGPNVNQIFANGRWHDLNCPELGSEQKEQEKQLEFAWEATKPLIRKCECGSEKVGSDRHSGWCPRYTK